MFLKLKMEIDLGSKLESVFINRTSVKCCLFALFFRKGDFFFLILNTGLKKTYSI